MEGNKTKNDTTDIAHIDIVKNFLDKPTALAINQNLLEIERLDRDTFERIARYVEMELGEARRKTPPDKKHEKGLPSKKARRAG